MFNKLGHRSIGKTAVTVAGLAAIFQFKSFKIIFIPFSDSY